MDPVYASRYQELYRHHWWWRARDTLVVGELERLAPPGGFGRILDVGCGDGLFFDRLRRWGEPEGVEPDVSLLTSAGRARGRIHAVPFDDNFRPGVRYGLVVLLDVLEHLPDPVAALRRVDGLLAPDGVCMVTVPALPVLWTSHDEYNHHRARYTRSALAAEAAAAGLRVASARYTFHWLVPLKLAVRAWEAVRREDPGPAAVPPAAVNRALYLACRLEQVALARHPLPFGSSMVGVLRHGRAG